MTIQNTEPIIRTAISGEEAAIHNAHMRSIREICVKDHGEEEIRGWGFRPLGDRWIEAIKVGYVWVVEQNKQIYGVAYLKLLEKEGESLAYVHALYLTPEVARKGFGQRLALLMIDQARTAGAKTILLESTITGHDFYRKMGFRDHGEMNRAEIGGYPVTCFPMKMDLSTLL